MFIKEKTDANDDIVRNKTIIGLKCTLVIMHKE